MSDNFSTQNNTKLSSASTESEDFFKGLNDSDSIDDLSLPYDHMYASSNSNENGIVNTTDAAATNCQTAESEVKFLKEWLVLHLDLIQQQNDEILSKEKTIFVLQQENEMLKERINCMERGTPFHSNKFLTIHKSPEIISESLSEDMTQDLGSNEDNNDSTDVGELLANPNPERIECVEENDPTTPAHLKLPNSIECNNIESNLLETNVKFTDVKNPSESIADYLNSSHSSKYADGYSVHNAGSMKSLKMSIRRKRLCSNSSAFSNNDSASEEKRSYRKSRKKRKRIVKEEQILTTGDQYVTHVGEASLSIINPAELGGAEDAAALLSAATLEVPRWRIKAYTSCYTMEGTENLDDDVYNRRHSRLENDERRRKRWDVQRIREQRLVEKLKQRQDKTSSNSRTDDHSEPIQSMWPCVDDVKFLEICDNLPVSAFGHPIPKLQPSEFNLPWLTNPNTALRKAPTRKSTTRRRGTKR